MTDITLATRVVRSSDILTNTIDDALVMMDMEGGHYFSLNRIGSDIWERIAQPTPVADLCAQLVKVYQVEPDACQAEVLALLKDMAQGGLITAQG